MDDRSTVFIIFLLLLAICDSLDQKQESLECFSTFCIEYETRYGCRNCSGKILTKKTRTLWANYMDKLAIHSAHYRDYRDTPRCCQVQKQADDTQFCMSLKTSVKFKYYQLSCSYNNGNEFPPYGSALCQQTEKNGGCCQTNHCNLMEDQVKIVGAWNAKNNTKKSHRNDGVIKLKRVLIIAGCFVVLVILILVVALVFLCWKVYHNKPNTVPVRPHHEPRIGITEGSTNEWDISESGSGSGMPLLVPRTMARQIERLSLIGQGRYGEVWKGRWRGTYVAIKIFSSRDERSWFRETEMYRTVCLRHDNILGFISADNKDNGQQTQLWLITDYHPNGSLFDYLQLHTVSLSRMFRMIYSIISGMQHLHGQIFGLQGKPAIAHRDLKSRNILVKSNYTCCIADLGLAVKQDHETGSVNLPDNPTRVGTNRYMAPEVLNETIMKTIDAYKQADLYSLGLIFWELVRRCDEESEFLKPEPYALPYQDMVPTDPTVEEMTSIVCEQGIRPPVLQRWETHKQLAVLIRVMEECWHADPTVRPPALRIQKTIQKLSVIDLEANDEAVA